MHPQLSSRQDDLDRLPAHQRLMANLGIGPLLKSQSHAAALAASLKTNRNDDHRAPRDPKGFVRKASPDVHLTPAQRAADAARDRADELAYEKRRKAMQAGTNADDDLGHNPEDDEDDDIEEGSGSSLSKSLTPGAFERLKAGLHSYLAKSQPRDYDVSDFVRDLHRGPVMKPTPSINKSIQVAAKRAAKTIGVNPMKSINAKMASIAKQIGGERGDSLAKAITGGGAIGGLRMAAPQYTAPQVEAAAGAALAHGAIDAQSAQVIANSLALGGVGAVPSALMAKLRGE